MRDHLHARLAGFFLIALKRRPIVLNPRLSSGSGVIKPEPKDIENESGTRRAGCTIDSSQRVSRAVPDPSILRRFSSLFTGPTERRVYYCQLIRAAATRILQLTLKCTINSGTLNRTTVF